MAGSIYHLWLARRIFPRAFAEASGNLSTQALSAFQAGSVAPDIGFFPGGPNRLSHRIHHEKTGDFARHLLAEARTDAEEAFAAGWALHLYTDIHIHPLINDQVDLVARSNPGVARRSDLWHKRLEWGIDCLILERSQRAEWMVTMEMPLREEDDCQLTVAGRDYFERDADQNSICCGWDSLARWVGRMPNIFLWTGSAKPAGFSRIAAAGGRLVRPVSRLLGSTLAPFEVLENAVGLVNPLLPDAGLMAAALKRGEDAVSSFAAGWQSRFNDLDNLDLDTGQPIDG